MDCSLTEQAKCRLFLIGGGVLILAGAAGMRGRPAGLLSLLMAMCVILGLAALFEGVARLGVYNLPQNRDAVLTAVTRRIRRARKHILVSCSAEGLDELFEWRGGQIARQLEAKVRAGVALGVVHDGGPSRHSLTQLESWSGQGNCQVRVHSGHRQYALHGVLVDDRTLVRENPRHATPRAAWNNATVSRWTASSRRLFKVSLHQSGAV